MIDNLYIIENFNLNTLEGLDSLKTITGSLFRIDRNAITNLDGLANLQSITNLDLFSITGNNELTDFCGLRKGMESIPENLYLSIYFNAYNPTREAIINGNCAQ